MKKVIVPLLILIILALAGLSIYLLKTKTDFIPKIISSLTSTVVSPTTPVVETTPKSTFSDTFAKGLAFNYDPTVWDVRKFGVGDSAVTKDLGYSGSGVLATNKVNGGKLMFIYGLAFGVGGGWTPFGTSDVVIIGNGWARLNTNNASKPTYYYGSSSVPVFFKTSPAGFKEVTDFCAQYDTSLDVYPILSKEQCQKVKDGTIIGYIPQPQFSRSLRLERLVPLGQINPNWENDTYIQQTKIDDGFLLVEVRYFGNSPEGADTLVSQINF